MLLNTATNFRVICQVISPGSVWNCLWGHALKRFPGINRKSRVSYPRPRFLSSATSPSLPKKHYNGLINQLPVLETCIINFTLHHLVKLYNGLLGAEIHSRQYLLQYTCRCMM